MNDRTKETVTPLISGEELQKRTDELAAEIMRDFAGKTITMVCVLRGGVVFMVDLAKKLNQDVEMDFMEISSYGDSTQSGVIKFVKDLTNSVTDKDVLLVEDIIDSGRTLSYLLGHLKAQKPSSLKLCTLLDKPDRRVVFDCVPDYTGFKIPDEFVVGYGLDYAQRYRNLSYIGVLSFGE